ncbi:MAG: MarC family protein [Hellea sp.]|jgi:multiple antibiotic resistance protein|nr:MarC family protein [Hellea sp.]MBT3593966.1 MarC family protein [Hellea sp.]MBT4995054.1 MarC family protein [Hellea sp.]MBT5835741.1 MarC family protein [Hellea sp.]MBT7397762.1 MarC family protein [Hellea sp.]MDA8887686.1 MarC family protein [Hellea sp.]
MLELELFLSAFAVLFVIIDPPGCAPIFATLTRGTSRKHQVEMAFKSVFIAAIILSGFAYAGEFIFTKLGISLDSLRIAGGIMLFIIGLNMVFEKRTEKRKDRAEEVLETTKDPEDISVFPMGIPMIAGPGTMASLLILMGRANNWQQELTIMIALASVLLISLIAFLISGPLIRLMGETFTNILTRVLGVLLATLAAQFVLDGIKGALF